MCEKDEIVESSSNEYESTRKRHNLIAYAAVRSAEQWASSHFASDKHFTPHSLHHGHDI